MTEPTLSEINECLNRLEKRLIAFGETQEKMARERRETFDEIFNKGVEAGMDNCGHDFWNKVDEAYEQEKGQKAVENK